MPTRWSEKLDTPRPRVFQCKTYDRWDRVKELPGLTSFLFTFVVPANGNVTSTATVNCYDSEARRIRKRSKIADTYWQERATTCVNGLGISATPRHATHGCVRSGTTRSPAPRALSRHTVQHLLGSRPTHNGTSLKEGLVTSSTASAIGVWQDRQYAACTQRGAGQVVWAERVETHLRQLSARSIGTVSR